MVLPLVCPAMSPGGTDGHADHFAFMRLPFELQQAVLAMAFADRGISKVALLTVCSSIHDLLLPMLYAEIHLSSIKQALAFVDNRSGSRKHATRLARSYTFTLVGVPGGSTRGGRESAPGSPRRGHDGSSTAHLSGNDRLLLAAQAALLCPALEHLTLEMFGKRHSTLLTSSDYLAEEANTFRLCLSRLRGLRTFSWITPRINHNFVGFSVAVVDLAFGPLIEGLQAAAVDMTPDGRRVQHRKGSLARYAHTLEQITLHHCIFPLSAYPNESFFYLFAQHHPDDEDWLLFPHLQCITVRTAINVDPRSVALLALTWQLRLDTSSKHVLRPVERHQLSMNPGWDPTILLSDAFVKSIWGPKITSEAIRGEIVSFVQQAGRRCASAAEPQSANLYIRALEESANDLPRLSEVGQARLVNLTQQQLDCIVQRTCDRVKITTVADAIAGI